MIITQVDLTDIDVNFTQAPFDRQLNTNALQPSSLPLQRNGTT